jgi:hypothetical protein
LKNPLQQVNIPVQLGLQQSTGNFWIDNGLVYLINKLGQGTYPLDDISEEMGLMPPGEGDVSTGMEEY